MSGTPSSRLVGVVAAVLMALTSTSVSAAAALPASGPAYAVDATAVAKADVTFLGGDLRADSVRAGGYVEPTLTLRYRDSHGEFQRTITSGVTYSIDGYPDACGAWRCRMTVAGDHPIVGTYKGESYVGAWSVTPGRAVRIEITPARVDAAYWEPVSFRTSGVDAYGNAFERAGVSVVDQGLEYDPDARAFRSTVPGDHLVTATRDGITATATMHVSEPGPAGSRLYSWGDNSTGQLGLGTPADLPGPHPTPTQVGPDDRWLAVSAGDGHVLAIRTDGTLWGWGDNQFGQSGTEDGASYDVPMRVGTASDWVDVCASGESSYGLRSDGTLWNWGGTSVSDGNAASHSATPVRMGTESDWSSLECGGHSSLATKTDGSTWAQGVAGGSLGGEAVGSVYDGAFSESGDDLAQVGTDTWQYVDAGSEVVSAIRSDGTLWQWEAARQPCTDPEETGCAAGPEQVGSGSSWAAIDAEGQNIVLLDADGGLWAWGSNADGQLGDGTTAGRSAPARIGTAGGWSLADLGDGGRFVVALGE